MKHRIGLMVVALLGFSAACSTVKNTPRRERDEKSAVAADTVRRPHIVVMYGVRRPNTEAPSRSRMERMEQDSLAPVLERPADDMPVTPGKQK